MPRSPFSRRTADGDSGEPRTPLDGVPLLAMLEPGLRGRVRKRLTRRRVAEGKLLIQQGDPSDALYFIDSGRFRVYVSDRTGRERVLRFLGPGEILGEAAFMAETLHVASAMAVESAVVWRLDRADFDGLVASQPGVLRYLANLVAERQAQANARLAAETTPEQALAQRGYVVAMFSPRGGAGVTTMATALGLALAERYPDDTVLLDLDALFGHVAAALFVEPRGVLATLNPNSLGGLERAGLDHYLATHSSTLRVMAASNKPEEGQMLTADHVRSALSTLRRHFGYVVVDLAHDFSEVTLAALELADRVLMIGTPERATLQDVLDCRRILSDVLSVPNERISYILNHPMPYTGVPCSEFSAATQTPWTEVPFGGEGPTLAALRGESLLAVRRSNPVARAAVSLADRVGSEAFELAALSGRGS